MGACVAMVCAKRLICGRCGVHGPCKCRLGAAARQGLAVPAAAVAGQWADPGPGPCAELHVHCVWGGSGRILQGELHQRADGVFGHHAMWVQGVACVAAAM